MNGARTSRTGKESGQVLVIVALFLIGLLAMLALVMDGGNIYLQRRRMQNAADAGAIAGARILALNGTTAEAHAAAQEYAVQRNKADSCDITIDGSVVTVVTHKNAEMTFARVVGVNQVNVSAQAAATFAPLRATSNLAPIAVQNFLYQFDSTYTIWDDDTDEPPDPTTGDITGNHRGWLNLACAGCDPPREGCDSPPSCGDGGASNLKEWMRNGYPGTTELDTWIRGSHGTKTSVIKQAYVGQLLKVAVYDNIDTLYPGKSYYHVVKFAAFKVTRVHFTGNPKGIEGQFKGYVSPGPPSDGDDGGLRMLLLTQ